MKSTSSVGRIKPLYPLTSQFLFNKGFTYIPASVLARHNPLNLSTKAIEAIAWTQQRLLSYPALYDQMSWMHEKCVVPPRSGDGIGECGTAACIAGNLALFDKGKDALLSSSSRSHGYSAALVADAAYRLLGAYLPNPYSPTETYPLASNLFDASPDLSWPAPFHKWWQSINHSKRSHQARNLAYARIAVLRLGHFVEKGE